MQSMLSLLSWTNGRSIAVVGGGYGHCIGRRSKRRKWSSWDDMEGHSKYCLLRECSPVNIPCAASRVYMMVDGAIVGTARARHCMKG